MKDVQNYLRSLEIPVIVDDSKSINEHEIVRLLKHYFELQYGWSEDRKAQQKKVKEDLNDFLSNFEVKEGVYKGLGKMLPDEMEQVFGKVVKTGNTVYAGRNNRSKNLSRHFNAQEEVKKMTEPSDREARIQQMASK